MSVVSYCLFTRKISRFLIVRDTVTVYREHHVRYMNKLHEQIGEYFFCVRCSTYKCSPVQLKAEIAGCYARFEVFRLVVLRIKVFWILRRVVGLQFPEVSKELSVFVF